MTVRLETKLSKVIEQLLLQHKKMLRHEPEETRELFERVISEAKKRNFNQFISDINQKDPYGQSLVIHNLRVLAALCSAKIDIHQWLSYSGEEKELYLDREKTIELWNRLECALTHLACCFVGSDFYDSVLKDMSKVTQMKKKIIAGQIAVPDDPVTPEQSPLFPTYVKTAAHFAKKLGRLPWSPIDAYTYWSTIHSLIREFTNAEQATKKEYSISLWRRDPLHDAFLGNVSECCISVGEPNSYPNPALRLYDVHYSTYPAGIFEFLVDVGVQVAEIKLEQKTIGACWLFLSRNENGKADLIVDSIDINAAFADSRPKKSAIRACVLRFLKKYAEAIGAERVLIGKTGPMMDANTRRPVVIDIPTNGLSVAKLGRPIDKLGGYFRDRAYFLESRHGVEAYQVK